MLFGAGGRDLPKTDKKIIDAFPVASGTIIKNYR
jgi:hypothetical protein